MKQNSQNFANQNKTSSKDARENPGLSGATQLRNRPNPSQKNNNTVDEK